MISATNSAAVLLDKLVWHQSHSFRFSENRPTSFTLNYATKHGIQAHITALEKKKKKKKRLGAAFQACKHTAP